MLILNRSTNLQDIFLNSVRKEKITVEITLSNNSTVSGLVKGFDNFVIILDCNGKQQMLYKHAICSILPSKNINISVSE